MTASSTGWRSAGSRVGPQHGAGLGSQLAHPELLGPAVGGVVILAAAPVALGFA